MEGAIPIYIYLKIFWNNNLRGVVRRNRENIGGTMRKKEIGSRFKYSVGICAFKSNSKSPTSGGFY